MTLISSFKNWLPFKSDSGEGKKENPKEAKKKYMLDCHKTWLEKYPELKMMEIESNLHGNKFNWLYILNKKYKDSNIELLIEIEKDENWFIELELIEYDKDDTLLDLQYEKHYIKRNLDWENLNKELSKVCDWIRDWNYTFFKERGVYPLVD